jgi:hypothetical protein
MRMRDRQGAAIRPCTPLPIPCCIPYTCSIPYTTWQRVVGIILGYILIITAAIALFPLRSSSIHVLEVFRLGGGIYHPSTIRQETT